MIMKKKSANAKNTIWEDACMMKSELRFADNEFRMIFNGVLTAQ